MPAQKNEANLLYALWAHTHKHTDARLSEGLRGI